jgi:hypothetical protein
VGAENDTRSIACVDVPSTGMTLHGPSRIAARWSRTGASSAVVYGGVPRSAGDLRSAFAPGPAQGMIRAWLLLVLARIAA